MQDNRLLKTDHQKRVEAFMRLAEQAVPCCPSLPSKEVRLLRGKLIFEEAMETLLALGVDVMIPVMYGQSVPVPLRADSCVFKVNAHRKPDLIEIADGCADISVVTIGTLSACGISDGPLLREVDESNLRKFGPGGHRQEDGKWIKPLDWKKPDIDRVLKEQIP